MMTREERATMKQLKMNAKEARKNETPEEKRARIIEALNTVKEVGISTTGLYGSTLGAAILISAVELPVASALGMNRDRVKRVIKLNLISIPIMGVASRAVYANRKVDNMVRQFNKYRSDIESMNHEMYDYLERDKKTWNKMWKEVKNYTNRISSFQKALFNRHKSCLLFNGLPTVAHIDTLNRAWKEIIELDDEVLKLFSQSALRKCTPTSRNKTHILTQRMYKTYMDAANAFEAYKDFYDKHMDEFLKSGLEVIEELNNIDMTDEKAVLCVLKNLPEEFLDPDGLHSSALH